MKVYLIILNGRVYNIYKNKKRALEEGLKIPHIISGGWVREGEGYLKNQKDDFLNLLSKKRKSILPEDDVYWNDLDTFHIQEMEIIE